MSISILVHIGLIIICFAVNFHFNELFHNMKSICRIHFIDSVFGRTKRLDRHDFSGFIRHKGINGLHLVSIAVTLAYQFLALIRYTINLVSGSRLQHLLFRLFILFQYFEICLKQLIVQWIGIYFSILGYFHIEIIHMDSIDISRIYLMNNISTIIEIAGNCVAITICLDNGTFVIRTSLVAAFTL